MQRAVGCGAVGRAVADLRVGDAAVEVVGLPELGLLEGVGEAVALDDHHVAAEGVEHVDVRQREHLLGVVYARRLLREPEGAAQGLVGEGGDARGPHAAQILGQAVGGQVVQGGEDALARGHGKSVRPRGGGAGLGGGTLQ